MADYSPSLEQCTIYALQYLNDFSEPVQEQALQYAADSDIKLKSWRILVMPLIRMIGSIRHLREEMNSPSCGTGLNAMLLRDICRHSNSIISKLTQEDADFLMVSGDEDLDCLLKRCDTIGTTLVRYSMMLRNQKGPFRDLLESEINKPLRERILNLARDASMWWLAPLSKLHDGRRSTHRSSWTKVV